MSEAMSRREHTISEGQLSIVLASRPDLPKERQGGTRFELQVLKAMSAEIGGQTST
jgi:hypothetical protein